MLDILRKEKFVKRYKALYTMGCSKALQVFTILSRRSVTSTGDTLGAKGLVNFKDLMNKGILSSLNGKVDKPCMTCKALMAALLLLILDSESWHVAKNSK